MGRWPGGLTSKIHAVVDANGPPVRLGPTADEAHDNRLALSMVEVFPTHIRCSALSFAYSISLSVFGGTAPMVAVFIVQHTQNDLSPACT